MATGPQQTMAAADQSVLRVAEAVSPPAYDTLQADQEKRAGPQQFAAQQVSVQQPPVQQVPTQQAVPFQAWPTQGQPGYFQAPLTGVAQGPVQYVAVS